MLDLPYPDFFQGLTIRRDTNMKTRDTRLRIIPGSTISARNEYILRVENDLTLDIQQVGPGGLDQSFSDLTETEIHVYLIYSHRRKVVDCIGSADPKTPTLPDDFGDHRRIGTWMTDDEGRLRNIHQIGAWFFYDEPLTDYAAAQEGEWTIQPSLPDGIPLLAVLQVHRELTIEDRNTHTGNLRVEPAYGHGRLEQGGATNGMNIPIREVNSNMGMLVMSRNLLRVRLSDWRGSHLMFRVETQGWHDFRLRGE